MDKQFVIVVAEMTGAGEAFTLIGPFADINEARAYEDAHVDAPAGASASFMPIYGPGPDAPFRMTLPTE